MEESINKLKKYDLHCHLDGSLSAVTVRRLAEAVGKELPFGEALLPMLRAEPDCKSLKDYLTKFELPLSCLVTKESFRTAVLGLLFDGAQENVAYMEIRFAPLLSVHEGLSVRKILEGAIEGLQEGKALYGIEGSLIVCGMRHMEPERNAALVREARKFLGNGVCAVDLAGDEAAFPVKAQAEMFAQARRLGMPFTIHAGECGSPQSIRDALELGALRIGHGIAAGKDKGLMKLCGEQKICFEMCPSSNFQTKAVSSPREYPFLEFLEAGIPVTVNTDNRTVSNTTVTKELEILKKQFHLSIGDMEQLMGNAQRAAFGMQG